MALRFLKEKALFCHEKMIDALKKKGNSKGVFLTVT
jgi:hypothetical protein